MNADHQSKTDPAIKLSQLVAAYYGSRNYQNLAPATRLNTEKSLARVAHMMDRPVDRITRGLILNMMDDMPPGSAAVFASRMRALMAFAVEREALALNPLTGIKVPSSGEYRPWSDGEMIAFLAGSDSVDRQVRLAVTLGYYTGQRLSDVLKMRWDDLHRGAVYVKQRKTKVELYIPIHPRLQVALSAADQRGETILAQEDGSSYSEPTFRKKFWRERERLGLPKDLTFHGLRKTMAARLAAKGATSREIMAVGGWTTSKQVDHYTKGADQFAMAKSAMARLV